MTNKMKMEMKITNGNRTSDAVNENKKYIQHKNKSIRCGEAGRLFKAGGQINLNNLQGFHLLQRVGQATSVRLGEWRRGE